MQLHSKILVFVALMNFHPVANGSDFTIDFRSNNETVAKIDLKINADSATASRAGETEKFNLKQLSWFNEQTGRWVTLTQCKEWADQSKAKTTKSAHSAPANVRPFILWSLEPTFKAEESGDTLRLTSGQVDYVIQGDASKTDVDSYFRYALLNAYKKAMTEKKLPPFAELKAVDEMKKLGRIPSRISVRMPGVPGAPAIELAIRKVKQ